MEKNTSKIKIFMSEEFKAILQKMNSAISKILLNEEIDAEILRDFEKDFNYLDVSHSTKGYISYLTKDKIEKVKSEKGEIDYWNPDNRFQSKPGGFIKKLIKCSDYEIQYFSNEFISITDPPVFNIKVVKGEDIAKFYNNKEYADGRGSLGGSCMSNVPAEYFDIYVQNPDSINMVVMFNGHDKVVGRAILWVGDDFKIMDRLYVSDDKYSNLFYNWANENDCYYKQFNNYNTPIHLNYKNQNVLKKVAIKLQNVKFDKYPYLDSFKWLDKVNKIIYNYIPDNINEDFIVIGEHTGNYFGYEYYAFCEMDDKIYNSTDIEYVEYLNKYIYVGHCVYSSILKTYILSDDSKYLDNIGEYIFNERHDHLNDYDLIKSQIEKMAERAENEKKYHKSKKLHSVFDIENSSQIVYDEPAYSSHSLNPTPVLTEPCDVDESYTKEWVERDEDVTCWGLKKELNYLEHAISWRLKKELDYLPKSDKMDTKCSKNIDDIEEIL